MYQIGLPGSQTFDWNDEDEEAERQDCETSESPRLLNIEPLVEVLLS